MPQAMWTGPPPDVPRGIRPDQQVWPPRQAAPIELDEDGSTQPFPAVSGVAPPPANRPEPPQPAPEAPAPEKARPRRTGLRIALAAGLLAVAVAAPTIDGYLTMRVSQPADIIHTVPAGQALSFMHVSWKAAIERMEPPKGARPAGPGRTWLKITVNRTALDHEGLLRSGDPEFQLKHDDGRTWMASVLDNNVPLETADGKIGQSYQYNVISIVPIAVADQVRLHLRPSTYRRDQPVEDLFKETDENTYDVLTFER
ncbi:hypothetical protein [Streptosporangium sp. KLBMP 9127]|nr:hypothetical protein [Streptosporangium sp. KLBMP 9127]